MIVCVCDAAALQLTPLFAGLVWRVCQASGHLTRSAAPLPFALCQEGHGRKWVWSDGVQAAMLAFDLHAHCVFVGRGGGGRVGGHPRVQREQENATDVLSSAVQTCTHCPNQHHQHHQHLIQTAAMEDLRSKLASTPLRSLASGGDGEQDPIALEHSATVAEALKAR